MTIQKLINKAIEACFIASLSVDDIVLLESMESYQLFEAIHSRKKPRGTMRRKRRREVTA